MNKNEKENEKKRKFNKMVYFGLLNGGLIPANSIVIAYHAILNSKKNEESTEDEEAD
jgi:hypothetical protein